MPDQGPLTDGDLLARAATGEAEAFAEFVARHGGAVYRFLRALGAADATEDLLQETLVDAWRGAAGFRSEGSARSWLLTTARRRFWRARKRAASRGERESLEELAVRAGWGERHLARDLAPSLADRLALEQAVSRLSATDREVILLLDVEGLSPSEAAEAAGLSLPALKSRLHRARLRLAEALRGRGMP